MKRPHWSTPLLARHIQPAGLFERPTLQFRMRMAELPSVLPDNDGYCYRWRDLKPLWPAEWVELFARLDCCVPRGSRHRAWKYVDLLPEGSFLVVTCQGYTGESPRPLLPNAVLVLNELLRRGVSVEVNDPAPPRRGRRA